MHLKGEVMREKLAPWQRLGTNLKLGLRARDETNWLPFTDLFGNNRARGRQLATKSKLFETRYPEVFAALPNARAASVEVLEMVIAHIHANHPKVIARPNHSGHPLEAAARLIPEDLLLLKPQQCVNINSTNQPDWLLVAGALCFPAHWILQEKMNKPLVDIHKPVPHYAEKLGAPVDRFFNNMKIGSISTRMNWSLQTGDALFTPIRCHQLDRPHHKKRDQIHVRVESQTFRKLPKTGQVLFTIHTHLAPVADWFDTKGAIQDLLDFLEGMTPEMRIYKGAAIYEARLKKILASPKKLL